MQVALDRALRQIQECGDVLHALVLEIEERDDRALHVRKAAQRLMQGEVSRCALPCRGLRRLVEGCRPPVGLTAYGREARVGRESCRATWTPPRGG